MDIRLLAAAFAALAPAVALAAGPLEGNWMAVKADKSLDPSTIVSFKVDKKSVSVASPGGIAYTAKIDGPDVPIEGDTHITSVSIKMPQKNVLVESAKGQGKPWQTTQYEAAPDGKTMKVTWKNHKTNKSGGYDMVRQ